MSKARVKEDHLSADRWNNFGNKTTSFGYSVCVVCVVKEFQNEHPVTLFSS
jgi:hypothetical protein